MPTGTYPDPIDGLTPGTIIITEEIVETAYHTEAMDENPSAALQNQSFPQDFIPPIELEVFLNGKSYILKCIHPNHRSPNYAYGDFSDVGYPIFDNNPVVLGFQMNLQNHSGTWKLGTPEPGTYTVSAKIPEEKSTPKVLSFPKGRTIVSELSRLNKAFGSISKKKTIIGQLSDLADAAEAGKIGGGSGALMVHAYSDGMAKVLDKTWQEIYDALKTTSVYLINEYEDGTSVSTNRRIVSAWYSDGTYGVSDDDSWEFKTDSSDGYPNFALALNPEQPEPGGGMV